MTNTEAIDASRSPIRPRKAEEGKQSRSMVRRLYGPIVMLSIFAGLIGGGLVIAWHAKWTPDVVVREVVSPGAMTPHGSTPQGFEFKLSDLRKDRKLGKIESLRLFEESAPLRLAAESGAIQASERGVYMRSGHAVVFTTGDASDPRTNAKSYSVSYLVRTSPSFLAAAGTVLLLASVLLALGGLVAAVRDQRRRGDRPAFLRTVAVLLVAPLFLPSLFIVNQNFHIYPHAVIRGLAVVEPGAMRFDQPANNRYSYLYPFLKVPRYSDIRLFEDGNRLGPSLALHNTIRERGEGRYSIYGRHNRWLYFSSSDGTDPRENGRIYTLSYPVFVSDSWVNRAGIVLFLVAVVFLYVVGWQRMRMAEAQGSTRVYVAYAVFSVTLCVVHLLLIDEIAAVRIAPNLLLATLLPLPGLRFGKTLGKTIAVLVIFTAYFGIVMVKWQQGISDGLMLGGLFPWSDGNGYLQGAFQVLNGEAIDPVSSRRPIHPLTLALLLGVTGSDIQLTIVAQTLLVAVGVVFLGWVLVRRASVVVAFFMLLAILLFLPRFLGTTWTETSGILWGCLATGFLIEAAYDRRWLLGAVSVFLLSWALNARAGAMFVIPMACIWLAWEHGVAWRSRARRFAVYVAVAAVPFVVTSVIATGFGSKSGMPFANYPLVLYGTLTGGNWVSGWTDPRFSGLEEREQAVALMQAVKEIIVDDPSTLLRGVKRAYSQFQLWPFARSDSLRWTLNLLSILGAVMSLITFRRYMLSRLMVVGTAGILLSVPFAPPWDSDGMRVYAATLPLSGVLVGWGIAVVFSMVGTKATSVKTGSEPGIETPPRTELRLGMTLVPVIVAGVIALMPLLYKTVLSRERISSLGPQQRVLTFFPLSGNTVHIVADGSKAPSLRPLEIEEASFDRGLAVLERLYPVAGPILREMSRPGVSWCLAEGFNAIIIPSERLENSGGKRVVINGTVISPTNTRFSRVFIEESLLSEADNQDRFGE